ncbi:MAG: hypothetical protein EOO24_47375 [Comamonadaceae bacterium]|nr:MAG: hypothetical protein EOO24_47375 [Comamonadaceae bacterium]
MLKQRLLLAVLLACAAFGGWWIAQPGPALSLFTTTAKQGVAGGMPVVMPTSGGRLEVASVTVYERFRREDVKNLLGVELPMLGTTETHLQLRTVYRYHIEMQRAWPIERHGDAWVVRAGAVKPSLPVAFDTRDLQHYTREGWARFNASESTVDLLRGISPELETRAQLPAYRQLAADAGRKTVADFVRTWLLEQRHATDPAKAKVVVLYPGEEVGQQE